MGVKLQQNVTKHALKWIQINTYAGGGVARWLGATRWEMGGVARPCLDPKFLPKFYYVKRRFPIILKCRAHV
jgi:hypothetical protein